MTQITPKIDLIALIANDLGQGTSKNGGRKMLFHCPFPAHKHGDKHPSLDVVNGDSTRPPFWKCWSCGKQGGTVKWMMEYRGLSYADALDALRLDKPGPTAARTSPAPVNHPAGRNMAGMRPPTD